MPQIAFETTTVPADKSAAEIAWLSRETGRAPYATIGPSCLLDVHLRIFTGHSWCARWRDVNVRVGDHIAPSSADMPGLMLQLMERYRVKHWSEYSLGILQKWYSDFETIHPFQDGNGRVGGAVVAVYSHLLEPAKGWLAPNQ